MKKLLIALVLGTLLAIPSILHAEEVEIKLSVEELEAWYEAVKDFSEYSKLQDQETGTNTLYGTPVDYSLHPDALTNLCYNLSEECSPQETTITP